MVCRFWVIIFSSTFVPPVSPFLCGILRRPSSWIICPRSGARMQPVPRRRCCHSHALGLIPTQLSSTRTESEAEVQADSILDPSSAAIRQQQRKRRLSSANQKDNPKTDRFRMKKFHHVEFYCGDATAMAKRFVYGLGMSIVAKSDQSTGNTQHASYVVQSNDLRFLCTAPYAMAASAGTEGQKSHDPVWLESPLPGFDLKASHDFFRKHGVAGRAIGIEVQSAREAYEQCVRHGGKGVQPPTYVNDAEGRGGVTLSEVYVYGDVVLRFISFDIPGGHGDEDGAERVMPRKPFVGAFLPNFKDVEPSAAVKARGDFGLERVDHVVGNVWDLLESVEYLGGMTGMHEFAEFSAADIGTVDSGLNSIVLASNSEMVLLPLNEPTFGTAKKSQIQTFLEQNGGAGLQHMALKTNNIFRTARLIRNNGDLGGFELLEPPGKAYYRDISRRIPSLTSDEVAQLEDLGLLADQDEEGILLQVFTKPVGDRPTMFFEFIQRIGCTVDIEDDERSIEMGVTEEGDVVRPAGEPSSAEEALPRKLLQRGGCGGFGVGNFKALFEAVEKYESTLSVNTD